MFEQGIVREVRGDRVVIEIRPVAPESCATCGTCAEGSGSRLLEVDRRPDLMVGRRVRIEVGGAGELGPAAIVFLLPVAGILVGAIAGSRVPDWVSRSSWSPTLFALLGAGVCLAFSVALIRLYDRGFRRKHASRVVVIP